MLRDTYWFLRCINWFCASLIILLPHDYLLVLGDPFVPPNCRGWSRNSSCWSNILFFCCCFFNHLLLCVECQGDKSQIETRSVEAKAARCNLETSFNRPTRVTVHVVFLLAILTRDCGYRNTASSNYIFYLMGVIKEATKVVDWLCAEDEKEAMATSPGDSPKNVKTQK